jgi:hypothetical protein
MLPTEKRKGQPPLEGVHELFDQWRKNKRRRDPIPAALWQATVSLAAQYSINQICRRLHLSYNELKARAQGRPIVPVTLNSPAFIELDPVRVTIECVIEMERPSGERMRIKGSCNVVELAREFWTDR